MTTKWVGMPDREAFVEIFTEVKQAMEYAHRMRGETTDEDLVEKLIWRLEAIIEYKGEPNDFK
tara:strand:- start:1105 stop:1293 length:189 start_codon:yes stop_codon:yes gene_type:complete